MFQPARGTRDIPPDEMRRRNWVLDRIRKIFERYGFDPLGTPAFESWEMLKMKSGEDVINQIYYFRDKSDRELGLRFEWTSSLCRFVASHRELSLPFKRYAIGPVWRYEAPSEKRFREFWQADVDIIGVADHVADAEVLSVAVDCLESIGFEGFIIRLNDRRILDSFLKLVNLPRARFLEIFRVIDKLSKIGKEGVEEELKKLGVSTESSKRLLELIDVKGEPESTLAHLRPLVKGDGIGLEGCEALRSIYDYSTSFGIESYLNIDLSLARGLDYYTGPVYEILAEGFEDYGSIAGGGRYDDLIGVYGGRSTPATGVSLGIERIVSLLDEKGVFKDLKIGTPVKVAYTSKKLLNEAIKVTQKLRRSGIASELDPMGRTLTKQLENADKRGVEKVVIIGEKEFKNGKIILRDMGTMMQEILPLEDLVNSLSKYIDKN
ncbi:MAG: histidine--tRNA ligase [Candidatus Bathyarchaeia archaeon]